MTVFTPLTLDEVTKNFPPINKENIIVGELHAINLVQIILDQWTCASKSKHPGCRQFNALFMVTGPQFWPLFAGNVPFPQEHYPLPPEGNDIPDLVTGNPSKNEIEQRRVTFDFEKKRFKDAVTLDTALQIRFLNHLPEAALESWNHYTLANPNTTIGEMIAHFAQKYGDTTPEQRRELKQRIYDDWDVTKGFVDLVRRLTTTQMVCALINNPLTEKEMMEAGTLAIKNTLMYSSEVKEWLLEESTTEQNMESWKTFWEKKIRIANMAVAKDASTMGYGINNMEEDTASEERFLETAGQFAENAAKREEVMVNMIEGYK